jgi:UDP-glucose 4-epimerase
LAERVLVTGAAGFIGSHLVRRLVAEGYEVLALVRPGSDPWRLHEALDHIEVLPAELTSLTSVGRLDRVFHLAAAGVSPTEAARKVVETNVLGTLAALQLGLEAGATRFVYCGSCFEYGPGELHREDSLPRPISEYGASKAAGRLLAEAFSHAHRLPVVSVLPFTVYGPYEAAYRLVPSVCLSIVRGDPIELTTGEQTRDLVYVEDVVEGLLAASRVDGGTFNLCTGNSIPVYEVARRLVAVAGVEVELRRGALPSRPVEFLTLSGDPSHTARVLGWEARTALDDGLRLTLDWFRERSPRLDAYTAQGVRG